MWFHTGGRGKYIKRILDKFYFSLGFIHGKTFMRIVFSHVKGIFFFLLEIVF